MCAFHVIRINLQLRLGVDSRVIRKQQVLIGLLCIRLLGRPMNIDAAVKNALGLVIEDAIKVLVTRAVRFRVFDDHVVVGELILAGKVEAVQYALQSFAGEFRTDVVARKPGP